MKFCMEHGIDEEVCAFANRLVDLPEEMIPKLLKDDRLKEYLADRTDFTLEELERIREETEIVWKIKTGRICDDCSYREKCKFKDFKVKPKPPFKFRHDYKFTFRDDPEKGVEIVILNGSIVAKGNKGKKFLLNMYRINPDIFVEDYELYWINCPICRKETGRISYSFTICHSILHNYGYGNLAIELIKEIAQYFYGEDGVKAVVLHLELDELPHIEDDLKQRIPAYLSRNLYGNIRDLKIGKSLSCSNFIRKYIFKDPYSILRSLKPSNILRFKQNLAKLLRMTVGEFLGEYSVKYEGVLKDKKIGDLIREYKDRFGELPKFIESLSDDLT